MSNATGDTVLEVCARDEWMNYGEGLRRREEPGDRGEDWGQPDFVCRER